MDSQEDFKSKVTVPDSQPTEQVLPTVLPVSEKLSIEQKFLNALKMLGRKRAPFLIALGILIFVGAALFFYATQDRHVAVKQFTNVYSFVPEKISKSASIQINLPEGVSEDVARDSSRPRHP